MGGVFSGRSQGPPSLAFDTELGAEGKQLRQEGNRTKSAVGCCGVSGKNCDVTWSSLPFPLHRDDGLCPEHEPVVCVDMGVGRRHLAESVCPGAGQMQRMFGMRARVAGTGRGGFFCPAGLNHDTVPAVAGTWQHLFNMPLFSCCKSVLPGRSSWQVERGRRRGVCVCVCAAAV